jgi:hypothetical protein
MKKLILTALLAPFMAFGQYSPADDVKSAENRLLTIETSLFEYRQQRNKGYGLLAAGAVCSLLAYQISQGPSSDRAPGRMLMIIGGGLTITGTGLVVSSTRHFKKFKP